MLGINFTETLKQNVHKEIYNINNMSIMKNLSIEIHKIDTSCDGENANEILEPNIEDNKIHKIDVIVAPTVKIHTNFQLPVSYLDASDVFPLSTIVCEDLELTQNRTDKSMYEYLFLPKHPFAKEMMHEWKKQYTTNIDFINDTQSILKNMETYKQSISNCEQTMNYDNFMALWKDIKEDDFFLEKYR